MKQAGNEQSPITSFVVRCNQIEVMKSEAENRWRIKVTYVQGDSEMTFESLKEAYDYMKHVIGE